jgi:hypothetical protein
MSSPAAPVPVSVVPDRRPAEVVTMLQELEVTKGS